VGLITGLLRKPEAKSSRLKQEAPAQLWNKPYGSQKSPTPSFVKVSLIQIVFSSTWI